MNPIAQTSIVVIAMALMLGACGDNRVAFQLTVIQSSPPGYHLVQHGNATITSLPKRSEYPRYQITEVFPDYETAREQGISLTAVAEDGTETPFVLRPIVCRESCEPPTPTCGDSLVTEIVYQGTTDFQMFNHAEWYCRYADGAEIYDNNNDV